MTLKAIIFDLDGTLIESHHDYQEMGKRVREIFKNEGVPPKELNDSRRIWEIIGVGVKSLKNMGFEAEEIKYVLERINDSLNEVELLIIQNVRLKPGALEILKFLGEKGMKIGIATRSCHDYATKSLEKTGISDFVAIYLGRDQVEHPKPDPRHLLDIINILNVNLDEVFFVGDTATDHQTALSAGIRFIGYPSNDTWKERMIEAGDLTLISNLKEIKDFIP
jgi:phosphoglycolate phosphatase